MHIEEEKQLIELKRRLQSSLINVELTLIEFDDRKQSLNKQLSEVDLRLKKVQARRK